MLFRSVVVTGQFVVLLHFYVNLYVSGNAVHFSGMAFAFDGQNHSVCYAGRNLNFYNFIAVDNSFAATFLTFVLDYSALSVTVGAGALGLHPAEHGVNGSGNVSRSLTGGAGFGLAVFASASVAVGTGYLLAYLEFLGDASLENLTYTMSILQKKHLITTDE